ncbi:MAG: PIN domain-containing protein [Myxococcota bacterium]
MGLIDSLGEGPIALDTAIFIYWIEENPTYLAKVEPLFRAIVSGEIEAVTSAITLLEVLVVPYRAGKVALAERYERLLTRAPHLQLVDIDRQQLRAAAQLRAVHGVRTPDALQLAAGLATRATTMITNDRRLPAISGLEVLKLGDLA